MSLLPQPSLSRIAPRDVNSSTSSTSSPSTTIFSLLQARSVLSVLHFLALTFLFLLWLLAPPVFLCKLLNLDDSSEISSAKSRSSSTVVKFHLIPLLLLAVAFLVTQSKHSKNRNFDITHPCFTPNLIIN